MGEKKDQGVTVRFKLEEKDYRSYLYFDKYGKDKRFFPTRIAISLFLGLAAAFLQDQKVFDILLFLGISVFFFIVFMVFPAMEVLFACQNFVKKDKQGAFSKWQTFRFKTDEIQIISDEGEENGSFTYDEMFLAAETKTLFLCYFKKKLCAVVPKQYIEQDDYPKIVTMLENGMKSRFVRTYKQMAE